MVSVKLLCDSLIKQSLKLDTGTSWFGTKTSFRKIMYLLGKILCQDCVPRILLSVEFLDIN